MNPRQQNDQLKHVVLSDERNLRSATYPSTVLYANGAFANFNLPGYQVLCSPLFLPMSQAA
ncbi:hypothetical protein [Paenibacillus daejeonensis]|uniref:hypothetical protein n=1 Tax=Paenibacillus daejeonensis TaxID=135193 RepID=UPI0003801649|nr:hypothetical protein [Paenibacillus daejeonensis]